MTIHFEVRVVKQMHYVAFASGVEVIDTENIVVLSKESVTKVRAEESGATCYDSALSKMHVNSFPY